jgi:meso-butanediol dehydrogenase/(S,S)-butanediol dehydrogenase/diacetyl reductase
MSAQAPQSALGPPDSNPADARRVAVVTGAARGIGLAIAQWFLARGWRVVLLDIDRDTLTRTAVSLAGRDDALALPCDVSDPAQVEAAARSLMDRFGRVDALVNNAGVAVFKPIEATSFAEWRQVMATNLDGVFLCTQVFAREMKAGSAVVNIASISGLRASTMRVAYGTSKAAVIHLTRQQAVEYGNRGIRVNAVAPGPVETEMARQVHSPEIRADYRDAIPLARYGSLEEIAQCVGFLCSSEASYVNGQVLAADGGFDAAGIGLPTLRRSRQA